MRLPDLLNELAVAHGDGTLKKVIKAYQKIDLLILDEFLLSPVSTEQTRELLEIIKSRSVKGSVIFCTQFEPKGWYSRIRSDCDASICEAIIDRIIVLIRTVLTVVNIVNIGYSADRFPRDSMPGIRNFDLIIEIHSALLTRVN